MRLNRKAKEMSFQFSGHLRLLITSLKILISPVLFFNSKLCYFISLAQEVFKTILSSLTTSELANYVVPGFHH